MSLRRIAVVALVASVAATARAAPLAPCRIEVVEAGSGWPVPLVELRTVHHQRFVSDNHGLIAFDLPELMGRETWFDVIGHGYEVPRDGFGYRGVRLTPKAGETLRVEVTRKIIARRLGRITGAGLFAESQKLGQELDWPETGILGCDSVQNASLGDRLFWLWGDTSVARYPLGIFDCASATTVPKPLGDRFEPPVRIRFDYFTGTGSRPRGVAPIPGAGPTWLAACITLPDRDGKPRLVASYVKIKPPLEVYESGLCVWNDEARKFEPVHRLWTKSQQSPKQPPMPDGHAALWTDDRGKEWVLFGNPLPVLRCAATFEAWKDPASWERLEPQKTLRAADTGAAVKPHSGSIAWNAYRKRWVTVFMEGFGKPSIFGELWYAEADAPTGPWGPAVKVLSHENYTFYNPRLHPDFTPPDSPVLLFEGTYTDQFADRPLRTPRYDYNQMLYRLDLDDPKLAPARARGANDPVRQ